MINLTKDAYQKCIDEDIEVLEKFIPKDSIEKMHIILTLKWSVKELFKNNKRKL